MGRDQLQWLSRTLKASDSSWRIVAGFHPIIACDENIEQTETNQSFVSVRDMFLKYGVNAYLSGQACPNLVHKGYIAQISNQGPFNEGPCFTTIDRRMLFHKETVNGFFLHRVSSLELVTYFISLSGEVAHKIVLQPWDDPCTEDPTRFLAGRPGGSLIDGPIVVAAKVGVRFWSDHRQI
ncbi:hypothetical protein Acr_00g0082880 [Actinidia rufa]|uniref:Uncharacterized protein n=1 Tax=Actinidia rufa TaxID=165716 RepID=A0A7J0DUQ3_9ERIC|nr:hypothetical protein Acr_00g0082880 [Actinidia rufa]